MNAFLQELFRARLYKRTQGRVARQATFYAVAVVFAYAAYQLSEVAIDLPFAGRIAAAVAVFAVGTWTTFRVVNFPPFADFLVAVEAEMNKVSWPNRTELYRASVVVLVVIFVLASSIYVFDLGLGWIATMIRIR